MIDTTVLVDLERRKTFDALRNHPAIPSGDLHVSAVTIAELQVGVEYASTKALRMTREDYREFVLSTYRVDPITVPIAVEAGRVLYELQASGQRIGAHDSWVAATARVLGFPVVTANVLHFERVQGLRVIQWTPDI